MITLASIPFIRLLLAFLAGIIVFVFYDVAFTSFLLPLFFFLIGIVHLLHHQRRFRLYRYRIAVGILMNATMFFLGNRVALFRIDSNRPDHFTRFISGSDYVVIRLLEPFSSTEKTFKAIAEISICIQSDTLIPVCGRSLVYFRKSRNATGLNYGDFVLVSNKFQDPPAAKNPDAFDYKKYLSYREEYSMAFLDSADFVSLNKNSTNPLWKFTYALREKSIHAFETFVRSPRERSVAEALVIGYRSQMPFEVIQSFSAAGVVHVLAVSGLHVGILYALLDRTFFFIGRKRKKKIVKPLLILLLIWLFALLTGMTGSVVRATVMFSFFTMARILNRHISMANILGCSVLVILTFSPMMFMDVGFQLSYFAVFGITWLYPYLNSWLKRSNVIVDYAWKNSCLAIAAQTSTFPVAFFYFNQFPLYFIFANLVVIPAAAFALYTGIGLIAFQWLPPVANVLGKALEAVLWLLDEFVARVQYAPCALIRTQHWDGWQIILVLMVVILFIQFFIVKEKKLLVASLFAGCILVATHATKIFFQNQRSQMTIYAFDNSCYIEVLKGVNATMMHDKTSLPNIDSLYLARHQQLRNIQVRKQEELPDSNGVLQIGDHRLAVINTPLKKVNLSANIPVDWVLLTSSPFVTMEQIEKIFHPKMIIVDATNSFRSANYWERAAAEAGIPIYNMKKNGAFIIPI